VVFRALVVLVAVISGTSSVAGVIGVDNRREITVKNASPVGAVGFLRKQTTGGYGPGSYATCSGALVDKNILLVAAHCIYEKVYDGPDVIRPLNKFKWYRDLQRNDFYEFLGFPTTDLSQNRQPYPGYYWADITEIVAMGDYDGCREGPRNIKCVKNDWVLLRLNAEYHEDWVVRVWPYEASKHLRVQPKRRADNGLMYGKFYVAGYPEDLSFEERVGEGYGRNVGIHPFMMDHQCMIMDVKNGTMAHNCDIAAGMSGSPMLFSYEEPGVEVRPLGMVGISTFGVPDCPEYSEEKKCLNGGIISQNFIPAIIKHVDPIYTEHLRDRYSEFELRLMQK